MCIFFFIWYQGRSNFPKKIINFSNYLEIFRTLDQVNISLKYSSCDVILMLINKFTWRLISKYAIRTFNLFFDSFDMLVDEVV